MESFRPRHIPALLAGTAMGIGAILPLYDPAKAIRTFGLPEHIALSKPAQACFTLYGSRATCLGAAVWIFYLQGKLKAVDTILATMAYAGVMDAYVCWKEGVPKKAIPRVFNALFFGVWGLFGLTSGESLI